MPHDPNFVFQRLAHGIFEANDLALKKGMPLCEIDNEPASLRRARNMLSALCLKASIPDFASGLHMALAKFTSVPSEWGLPDDFVPDKYRNVVLIHPHSLVPTAEAFNIAGIHNTESDAREDIHYRNFMNALEGFDKNEAYTKLRRFLIENPAVENTKFREFMEENGAYFKHSTVRTFYNAAPKAWKHGPNKGVLCARCRSPLRQDMLTCSNDACADTSRLSVTHVDVGVEWLFLDGDLIQYWVSPGFDELELFKSLSGVGDVALYPRQDEVDISINDREVGIDVKSYQSPYGLGEALARKGLKEPLGLYKRPIVAVPDRFCDNDYLSIARSVYEETARSQAITTLEFLSISETKASLRQ